MPDFHVNQPVPSPGPARGVSFPGAAGNSALQHDGVVFVSASRAEDTAYTSDEMHNLCAKGVRLFIQIGTIGTTTLTVKIQVRNPASVTAALAWVDLPDAVTTALTADDTTTTLTVYPGIAETANISVSDHLGPSWRVVATLNNGDTTPVTFAVGADYLL